MAEMKVKGLAELQKVLDGLPVRFEKSVVRGALKQAGNVVRDEAKKLVPVRTGKLRKTIRVSEQRPKGGALAVHVTAGAAKDAKKGGKKKGAKESGAFYAAWVERGTQPHAIAATTAKALSIGNGGGSGRPWTAATVNHPGAKSTPFMTPAIDIARRPAMEAFVKYVKQRLAKQGINTPGLSIEVDD